jgi:tetratricopeptide (TPR) repeat protein
MGCLEPVRGQLEDTLAILEGAGASVVEHADELVSELPDPSSCAAPGTWAPVANARAIHREIARARALGVAGHLRVATETAWRAQDSAEATGDDGLRAEADLVHGGFLLESGEVEAASDELERAYLRATASGRDRVAFEAALSLTGLYASRRQDPEACRVWVERAGAALDRDDTGDDLGARGRLALAQARRGFTAGEYAEAVVHAREAVDLLEQSGDPGVTAAINTLAQLLGNLGRHEEARVEVERGVAVAERVRGPEHPATASVLKTLAVMQSSSGQSDEAFATLDRALAIYRGIHGDDDLDVAEIRRNIATAHARLGHDEEAAKGYREVLEIQRRHLPEDDSKIAQTLYNLSLPVRDLGDRAEAEALGREAVRIAEASIGGDHPTTAIYLHGLGQTLVASNPAGAVEPLERGREIAKRVVGEEHYLYAAFLTTLGEARDALGERQAARALLEQSLAIHDGPARGADAEAREETARQLARVLDPAAEGHAR